MSNEYSTSLEVLNFGDDGDYVEIDITMSFSVQPAEPDVGIMSSYPEDISYEIDAGQDYPQALLDKCRAMLDSIDQPNTPDDMQAWHDRNIERAVEELAHDDGGYDEWDR